MGGRLSLLFGWTRAAGALSVLFVLAACTGDRAGLPSDPAGKLFARGLDEIIDLYIEPVSSRGLALSGAARLARLDGKVAVREEAPTPESVSLVISYDGKPAAALPIPGNAGAHEWGRLLADTIAAAKHTSPQIAALPSDTVDKAVFDGITGNLDRFSRYASPEVARDHRAARDGFGGIGVTLEGEDFHITAVHPQGPADRAGVKPDDKLVAIDGQSTAGRNQSDVVHQLRGPLNSTLTVTVARPGGGTRDYRLQRALVIVPTVTMKRDGNVAVFRVASFNQSTTQRLAETLLEAQRQAGGRLGGIVLDLRSNPGGLLDQAVSLADLFIREGPIVSTVGRHPASKQYFSASGDSIAPRTPVVILINGGSASAAEIVAAALQDIGRAVVVGTSSYGKGTVQTVLRLPNDGELTLTWARLVTPSGYYIQTHGVVPTLCTADLADDDRGLAAGLQRASTVGARPRAGLDERSWAELRKACPSKQTSPALDVKLAERILADPRLYSDALHAIRPGSQFARDPAPRLEASLPAPSLPTPSLTGSSLTGPGPALSSDTRVR